jgi:molecular chaperone DnaJ
MNREEALKILGLKGAPEEQEIKKAYRSLAAIHHPDKNGGSKVSEEQFKKIAVAYETLTNPEKKNPQFGPGPDPFAEFAKTFTGGRFHFSGPNRADQAKVQKLKKPSERIFRMQDVELVVSVDVETLLLREPIDLNLQVECCCSECLSNSDNWHGCDTCQQAGSVITNTQTPVGNFVTQQPCSVCSGYGWVNKNHCKICKDKLVYVKQKKVSFKIPPDFKSGGKVRLSGAGMEGWNCPPSALIINPRLDIPDYSSLSEDDAKKLKEILGKK